MISEEQIKTLQNQIWITRISRINAEKRLRNKDAFIQAMSIYYSCFTVLLAICLFVWPGTALNIMSLTMTIALMISILHFNSFNYKERAMDFRKIYTELQKLEYSLAHNLQNEGEIKIIEENYCNLIAEGENHATFDYLKTIANSKESFKKDIWTKNLKRQYLLANLGRLLLKILCIFLPFIIALLIFWGISNEWL